MVYYVHICSISPFNHNVKVHGLAEEHRNRIISLVNSSGLKSSKKTHKNAIEDLVKEFGNGVTFQQVQVSFLLALQAPLLI